jgi:hypothetical protein
MAASTLYYVYLSNSNATTFASSLRGSTTARTSFNGIRYLGASGNASNWRFIGYVRTDGSTHFVDSLTQRFVINYYNRRVLPLHTDPGYNNDNSETTYSTSSTTYTEGNGGTGSKVEFIANGEDGSNYQATFVIVTASGVATRGGVGEDSTSSAKVSAIVGPSMRSSMTVHNSTLFSEGYHYLTMLVKTDSGTPSIYADQSRDGSGADPEATNLSSFVMG